MHVTLNMQQRSLAQAESLGCIYPRFAVPCCPSRTREQAADQTGHTPLKAVAQAPLAQHKDRPHSSSAVAKLSSPSWLETTISKSSLNNQRHPRNVAYLTRHNGPHTPWHWLCRIVGLMAAMCLHLLRRASRKPRHNWANLEIIENPAVHVLDRHAWVLRCPNVLLLRTPSNKQHPRQ